MSAPTREHEIVRPSGRLRFVTAVCEFLSRHLTAGSPHLALTT